MKILQVLNRHKDRHTYTKINREVDTQTQTHTHTHTHTNILPGAQPVFKACRMLSATAEILLLSYWVDTFSTWERIKLRKTREVTWVPPMSLKEDILPPLCQGTSKTNPESVPEAITWVEVNSSKVTMHVHTCIAIAWLHWPYSRNSESFLLRQLITVDLGNNNAEKNSKLLSSK
jgi:hypothetical protein